MTDALLILLMLFILSLAVAALTNQRGLLALSGFIMLFIAFRGFDETADLPVLILALGFASMLFIGSIAGEVET